MRPEEDGPLQVSSEQVGPLQVQVWHYTEVACVHRAFGQPTHVRAGEVKARCLVLAYALSIKWPTAVAVVGARRVPGVEDGLQLGSAIRANGVAIACPHRLRMRACGLRLICCRRAAHASPPVRCQCSRRGQRQGVLRRITARKIAA